MCSVTPLAGGQLTPASYNVSSVLNARLRRESRRSRMVINNARLNLEDYNNQQKSSADKVAERISTNMKPVIVEQKLTDFENPSDEISAWLQSLNNFDQRHIPSKVGILESNVSKQAVKFDPISALDDEFYSYTGGKDKQGECHGVGHMEYDDGSFLAGAWDHGVREGHFRLDTGHPACPVIHLEGDYRADELSGRARVQLGDETWLEGWYKESVLHGFCRRFDKNHRLTWVGMYRNGHPFGMCWHLQPGGGCVVGDVDSNGEHTGANIAYIYPDNVTAFVGQFDNGQFVRGVRAEVSGVREHYGCIKIPEFRCEAGPEYIRELATFTSVTTQPMLPDPYEDRMVDVRMSRVEGAEEGLFSRRAVKAGTVMAFYNGIRREKSENMTWDLEANSYKIFDPTRKRGTVDIPVELRSLANYTASLAHKTNHSFIPNCEFDEFHHPRFGLVPCIQAIHDIAAGEEIFVLYGYDLDYCPDWYMEAWDKGNFAIPESMKREYGAS